MSDNYDLEFEKLSKIEKSIKGKSKDNTLFAFSIILSEYRYKSLIKECTNSLIFQKYPNIFPWCHVKLITETYVRLENKKQIEEEHVQEEIALKLFKEEKLPYNLWNNYPISIKKINLNHTRDEGGPWSVVANVKLHAGIPKKRVKEIISELRKIYGKYNDIRDALDYYMSRSNFEHLHLSKYVKKAFQDIRIQKMFFLWLLKIIDFISEHDIEDLKNNPNIPDYIINYFHGNILSKKKKSEHIPQKNYCPYQGIFFDENKKEVQYKCIVKNLDNIIQHLPNRHKEKLYDCKQPTYSIVKFDLIPEDFPLNFWQPNDSYDFVKTGLLSNQIDVFVFKSNGEIIITNFSDDKVKINDEKFFILSREKILDLKKMPLDMIDSWWGWYLYIIEFSELNNIFDYKIGYPYEEMIFEKDIFRQFRIEWETDFIIKNNGGIKVFGGNKIPIFKIEKCNYTVDNIDNIWIDIFHDYSPRSTIKAHLEEDGDYFKWRPVTISDEPGTYLFNVKIFDFQFESDFIEDTVIWIRDFEFYIKPEEAIFPDQKSSIILNGTKNVKVISDDLNEEPVIKDNQIVYYFQKKPQDCNPTISMKIINQWLMNIWIDLSITLNYISIKLLYTISGKRMSVDLLDKPLNHEDIDLILFNDPSAKVIFFCNKNDSNISLLTEDRKIITNIYFKDFEDSIFLSQIKNYNTILVLNKIDDEERTIVKEIKIEKFWNYYRIFNEFRNEIFNKKNSEEFNVRL